MPFQFHPHYQRIQQEITTLLSKPPYKVGDFVDKKEYEKYPKQGIYAFTDPEDKEIVYIGKADKHSGGAGGRARHHERENKWEKDSVQRKLNVDQKTFRNYHVRVHEIEDPVVRSAAELYGIVVYLPKANRIGLETGGEPDLDTLS